MKRFGISDDSISDTSSDEENNTKRIWKKSNNQSGKSGLEVPPPQTIKNEERSKPTRMIITIDDSSSDEEIAKHIEPSPSVGPFSLALSSNDTNLYPLPSTGHDDDDAPAAVSPLALSVGLASDPLIEIGPFGQCDVISSNRISPISTIDESADDEREAALASPSSIESFHSLSDKKSLYVGASGPVALHNPSPVPVSTSGPRPVHDPSPVPVSTSDPVHDASPVPVSTSGEDPIELQQNISQQSLDSDSDEIGEDQHRNPLQQLLQVSMTKIAPSEVTNSSTNTNGGDPLTSTRVTRVSPGNNIFPSASDEKKFVHTSIASSKTHTTTAVDAFTSWRKGLWPPLSPFYRILLRCKCVSMMEATRPSDQVSNKKRNRAENGNGSPVVPGSKPPLTAADLSSVQYLGLEWTEFWDPSCLEMLPTTFDR
jgi:hypothetical protein